MGSYGIGPSRLVGTVAEIFSDDKSIVWPSSIAPFAVHLIALDARDKETLTQAEEAYNALTSSGIDTLFDDRDARPGEKFADADLIGIPLRVIVSARTVKEGKLEILNRRSGITEHIAPKTLATAFHGHL